MIRVLLVCGAGMSTSILVKKMVEADANLECEIRATDTTQAQLEMLHCDVFLLAPHIGYLKEEYMKRCQTINLPFMVISSQDYTKMDGAAVLEKVRELHRSHGQEHPFKVVLLHAQGGIMSDLLKIELDKMVKAMGRDWIVESQEIEKFSDEGNISLILLEPQVRFEHASLIKRISNPLTVVLIPDIGLYASFNGRKIIAYIDAQYPKKYEENLNMQQEKIIKEINKL